MLQILFTQFLVVISLVTLLFLIAQYKKDNSIIDIFFGPLIFITSISSLIYLENTNGVNNINLFFIVFTLLFLAWALRISSRIYLKNKGKAEDFRYKAFRSEWMKKGLRYFYIRSYMQVFFLQGMIVLSMSITPTYIVLNFINSDILSFIFLGLAFIGLYIEAISDMQLDKFIIQKQKFNFLGRPSQTHPSVENQVFVSEGSDKIMKTGLWKYSRHPNYFGESMFWWGLGFAAFSLFLNSDLLLMSLKTGFVFIFLFICFISPLLITFLLLFVSGIPMLEKKWDDMDLSEWKIYKAKTSKFLILPNIKL